MTRRALIVADAPAASGGAAWRRARMMAGFYRANGLTPALLLVAQTPPGALAARRLLTEAPIVAVAPPVEAGRAAMRLLATRPHAAAHFTRAGLARGASAMSGALRVIDMQTPAPTPDLAGADLVIAADAAGLVLAGAASRPAIAAPFPGVGRRKTRIARRDGRRLAGCWVEADAASIAAATAFFAEVARRGGGKAPNFALAGPGAGAVETPPLPWPVTRMPAEVTQPVFFRGLDIALAPDLTPGPTGNAPRLDLISALEHGAAPLASRAALTGLDGIWRLPCFDDLAGLAHFLFERGAEMGEGGMLAELNARADWTWSGLAASAARQRRRLTAALRAGIGHEEGRDAWQRISGTGR